MEIASDGKFCPLGSSCDMIINSDTSKTGVIMSPLYPSPYPSKTTCQYEFQGRGKELVRIIFHDFYLHHLPGKSKDCEGQDLLNAFIHIDGRMEKIDSFCGTTVPKPVMSNGPRLKLEFRSLHSSRYSRGFNASYSFTESLIKLGKLRNTKLLFESTFIMFPAQCESFDNNFTAERMEAMSEEADDGLLALRLDPFPADDRGKVEKPLVWKCDVAPAAE
ncbi:hypothetical protein YQE_11581, partial [Dendroctonus ponderosae]